MKNIFTKAFLLFLFTFAFVKIQAQELPYIFVAETDAYVELTDDTLLTSVGDFWDDPEFVVPLGFEFDYFEVTSDSVYFAIGLGAGLAFNPLDAMTEGFPILFPVFSDIMDIEMVDPNLQSHISYKTDGTAGNQIFKLQWKDVGFYNEVSDSMTANNQANFQLWMYEKTGDIEVRFGSNTITQPQLVHDGNGGTVGLIDFLDLTNYYIANYWYLSGAPAAPEVLVTDAAGLYTFDGFDEHPANGQLYRFLNPETSTETPLKNIAVDIYPTQIVEDLTVEVAEELLSSKTTLVLSNQMGQSIFQKEIAQQKENIKIGDLPSGIYYATIYNELGRVTKKIIKM